MGIKNLCRKLIIGSKADSKTYIEYLRSLGMKIGEETTIYVPMKTQIDTTRPWLITIGNNVMLGPNITLATPLHPLLADQRNPRMQKDGKVADIEYGAPITIGDNCWLASNVTVCAGVKIGNNCVIGAGAIVTKDIPDNSLAVCVPAKVIRTLSEKDRLNNYPY